MAPENYCSSPNILIYLAFGEKKIRLADVLYESATLFEKVEAPAKTKATLVFVIDGVEEREDVFLHEGIERDASLISFSYLDPARLNGRHFSLS